MIEVVGCGKQRSTTISGSTRMAIITTTILLLPYAHGLVAPAPRRPATQLDAVWSNELAIRDYQNLLQGKAEARREDGPSVVLGLPGDAIAAKFAEMAPGAPDAVLAFGDAIPETLDAAAYPGADAERLSEFPIYVCCTSPEACAALEPVLQTVPEGKKEDLVFLQKGDMLEDLLKRHGLCRERQTQAVLYVGVNAYGKLECDRVSIGDDAMGEPKFAAETCATGKWAGAVADRLVRHKFHCGEQFYRDWRRNMIELVVFECVYNLVGVLHQKVPVSEVNKYFSQETDDMLWQIQRALRGHLAVTLLSGWEERMAAYAETQFRSKSDNRPTAASAASPFRNNFFYDISQKALEKDFPDPCPMHTEYWEYGCEKGLVDAGAPPVVGFVDAAPAGDPAPVVAGDAGAPAAAPPVDYAAQLRAQMAGGA